MPRITLEGVSKGFATADGTSVKAADNLSLSIGDRELLTIVGPSGCGKTTALRLIAGLETVDAGRILFDDQPVTALPPAQRDVAMVFQAHALFPHLTAFENLAFGLKLRGVRPHELQARVRETAEWLGIGYCLDRLPGKLSGGERQRVALGRALVRRPRILLLDEPFSHLDEPLRVQVRAELLALRSRLEMTVVYVTHDQAEALSVGDRVAVLRQGCVQQVGLPADIYNAPANTFVAGFIGSPPMNLVPGMVAQREGRMVLLGNEAPSDQRLAMVIPLIGYDRDWFSQNAARTILLGVRPERVTLAQGAEAGTGGNALIRSLHYLGNETVIYLTVAEHQVVARTASSAKFRPGESVAVTFDVAGARVFDAGNGALIH